MTLYPIIYIHLQEPDSWVLEEDEEETVEQKEEEVSFFKIQNTTIIK